MRPDALLLAVALALPAPTFAQEDDAPAKRVEPSELRFAARHELRAGDRTLAYDAVAETTLLRDDEGEPEAEFFSFSYLLADASPTERPLTFVFNGGPGSASIWLHMGLVGPRVVDVPSDGEPAGAPPYPLEDNPETLLAVSDVVLIDPVGTGYSRVVGKGETGDHWGVDQDARSVARFVRAYLREKGRWGSPKYVLGESYGGIRGALLVRELQGGFDAVALNGLMLVSPALDMEVVDGQESDAAYATVLPTYAATAWYHDALPEKPAELEPFLDEVERFVETEYVPALFLGRDLPEERADALVAKLHRYTGLAPDYLHRANLKVLSDRFRRELLRERGLVVGRLDSRYTGTEDDAVGELPTGDPMAAGIAGAYVAAFHQHAAEHFGVDVDREYVVMSRDAGREWKRQGEEWRAFQGYLDSTPALARGMAANPELRLFVANGLYDLATTSYAAAYNLRRSTIDRARVRFVDYPAGHMMYVHAPSRAQLARDLLEFVAAGRPAAPARD